MQNIPTASLQKAFSQAARPIAVIGAVGGFIGDIIQPLGDFALWVAVVSFIIALAALIWIVVLRSRAGKEIWDTVAAGVFLVAVGSFVIFSVWALIFSVGPERGYLATNVPAIGDVQAQLLGLQRDVTEIKETTTQTATRVAEQSNVTAAQATAQAQSGQVQVAQATTQAQGFADIQRQFAALQAGQGTLAPNPQTPQEWYSNARLYELRGDTANAIKAYEGYFKFNLDFVDPYQNYVALLKGTEGIARTRQMIDSLYAANKASPTLDLISTSLLDSPEDRTARLRALTLRETKYGPGWLELGTAYNRAFQQTPTNDLAQKQQQAFETVFKLETDEQGYTRYFIDKTRADTSLTTARQLLSGASQLSELAKKLDFYILPSYDGVQISVIGLEVATAQQLLYSIDDPQPKLEAAKNTFGGQTTNNPNLGPFKLPAGEHTIYVQYTDVNGAQSEVFSKTFRVDPIAILFTQGAPDFTSGLVPITFTISIVDAKPDQFYTYRYSVDSPALDQKPDGNTFILTLKVDVKPGEHVLHIQATGDTDGKATPVVEFPFTVK